MKRIVYLDIFSSPIGPPASRDPPGLPGSVADLLVTVVATYGLRGAQCGHAGLPLEEDSVGLDHGIMMHNI